MHHAEVRSLLVALLVVGSTVLIVVMPSQHSHSSTPLPPLSMQQRRWQQRRWPRALAAFRAREASLAARGQLSSAASSPSQPASEEQAIGAQRAVQVALSQGVPARGDGRRGGYDDYANVKRESDTVRRMLQADGLPEWRPDPSLLPKQARPGASMSELLAAVPPQGVAWLAFGNAGVTEMLMNWVYHVCRLGHGKHMVVAAYDAELLAALRARLIPAYNYTGALPPIHFRGTPFLFHRMGFLKAMTIAEVLRTGRHVLVSDSDVVWLRDPTAELLALAAAGASLAPSTDCLSVESDRDKRPRRASPYLCGHSPGNADGAVFNTGIIFLASTEQSVSFCTQWANATLRLTSDQWWADDQAVFNRLLTGRGTWPATDTGFYPVRAAGLDGKLIHAPGGLLLAPLPAERFCSGHLVWVQQEGRVGSCDAVHATYTEFGDAGKRWRMVEAGLWGPLPPRYFEEGRFLTFTPPEPPADPAPCAAREGAYVPGGPPPRPCGGEDPSHTLRRPKPPGDRPAEEGRQRSARLRENLELMRRQLHALRDALALALVLNRTLVLPHFDCMCDRSELVYRGGHSARACP